MGPTPGTGDIVRVDHTGKKEILVSGLSFPTAMTFGPDGKLYVSNMGFGPGSTGGGEVLQVDLEHCTTPQGPRECKELKIKYNVDWVSEFTVKKYIILLKTPAPAGVLFHLLNNYTIKQLNN